MPQKNQTLAVLIISTLASTLLCSTVFALEMKRFELGNEINVVIAHIPGTAKQSTFTFQPLHLGNDGAGKAQWSHLIEHLIIRATDPTSPADSAITVNGETMPHLQRLDTYAEPEKWNEALQRHAAWLTMTEFAPAVLERERPNIAAEEAFTVEQGMTFKFAIAAWNQIVRHGREHAAVHGDVVAATIEQATAYAKAHRSIDESVWLATVGPTPVNEARDAIVAAIGPIEKRSRPMPPAVRSARLWTGEHTATWDLNNRHFMRWWLLPDTTPETLAMSNVVGQVIQNALVKNPVIREHRATPIVFFAIPCPEGTVLMIDTVLPPNVTGAIVHAAIDQSVNQTMSTAPFSQWSKMIATRTSLPSRLEQMQSFDTSGDGMAEAQWLITAMNEEYAIGAPTEQLQKIYATLDSDKYEAFKNALMAAPNGSLTLEPAHMRESVDADTEYESVE